MWVQSEERDRNNTSGAGVERGSELTIVAVLESRQQMSNARKRKISGNTYRKPSESVSEDFESEFSRIDMNDGFRRSVSC